ncbi:hypothetical protein BJV78DRAFT_1254894 [Lactifluus subvellereus]|nr:hypothetical protein BJV78DRAFT_1254894 [Lactifluus subvellereus]
MENLANDTIGKRAPDLDGQVLAWVSHAALEDSQLVEFFENIPGFCRSSVVDNPLGRLFTMGSDRLSQAVTILLERTWSSNFVSDSDKMRRLVACVKVADAVRLSDAALSILKDIFPLDQHKVLRSVELGQLLRTQGSTAHQKIGLCAQTIVAGILTNVQGDDDRWIALAADQLTEQEDVIRGYVKHGNDSVLLANLIHITRLSFRSLGDWDDRDMVDESSYILPSLSNFDIRNTLPELQQDFRDLWYEIDREAQNNGNRVAIEIRENIRNLYNALNPGTNTTPTTPPASNTNLPAPSSTPTGGFHPHPHPDLAEKDRSYALPSALVPASSSSTTALPPTAVHLASSSGPNVTTTTTTGPLSGIVVTPRDGDAEDIQTPTRLSTKALEKRPLLLEDSDSLDAHDDT